MGWRKRSWIVVAGVLVAACGGGDATPSAVTVAEVSPTSTTTSTTTEPATDDASVEAAVERAFHEQWDAFIEILSDPDPANPLIDRYFTGAARETILDSISRFVAEGRALRLPDDPSLFEPRIQRLELIGATEAVVVECTLDGLIQIDTQSGAVLDDELFHAHFENRFELVDGRWRVSRTVDAAEGEQPCDF